MWGLLSRVPQTRASPSFPYSVATTAALGAAPPPPLRRQPSRPWPQRRRVCYRTGHPSCASVPDLIQDQRPSIVSGINCWPPLPPPKSVPRETQGKSWHILKNSSPPLLVSDFFVIWWLIISARVYLIVHTKCLILVLPGWFRISVTAQRIRGFFLIWLIYIKVSPYLYGF